MGRPASLGFGLSSALRGLPGPERYAAFVGLAYVASLVVAYAFYIALGHMLLGVAYASPWLWEPSAELRAYEQAADLRVHRYLFRPLLIGLPIALGIGAWAFRRGPVLIGFRMFLRDLPTPHRALLGLLVVLLLAGQALDDKRALFPFARWSMYGRAYEPERMTMYDLYGVTESGERVLINIGRALPSIQRGAPRRLTETARALRLPPPASPSAGDLQRVDEVAIAIAAVYQALHGATFTAVEIVEENVHVEGPRVYRRTSERVRSVPLAPRPYDPSD
jgi:hypothetical protein